MKVISRRHSVHWLAAIATLGIGGLSTLAFAADDVWPARPVRILVGFPGGSTPDMAARTLADGLTKVLGQPVIVENRAGASGNIAAGQVAKAEDDHTLGVVINGNLTSAKMLYPKLAYDPSKDFSYLSLLGTAPLVLVSPTGQPQGKAFFEEAQKQGAKWNYGSVGTGSVAHLGMELLKSQTPGLQPEHVPFAGNPQVMTAMLGGQIQMALVPPGVVLPQIQAGKLQAIGLTSGRSPLAPNIAPLADAGIKNFNLEVWVALIGPRQLSSAAQKRLATEVPALLREPDIRSRLAMQGWQAVGSSPEGMVQRVKEEAATMAHIIATTGTKLE